MTSASPDQVPSGALATAAAGVVDATKVYGKGDSEVRALDGITISFEAGRFTAIMGPSGSGKSTLMHCLAGLDSLTSGAVYIGGTYLASLNENITLPLMLGGQKGDQQWIDRVIDAVGLRDRLKHRPSELSGGQQQRVAVARALATQPTIIFADEPTGNLDSRAGAEILDFMRLAVRELGQTIVMVTHDPVAASYADRVVFLADGRVVDEMADPTADSVLDRMKRFGD
jgi:putative ABC transport system ATP-binding protein